MVGNRTHKNWSSFYSNFIDRNIGLVSIEEQEKIRNSSIAVFGVGGLGGTLAEELARSGCEHISLFDNATFEVSNLNRQLCYKEDIGRFKVEVIEKYLKKINPDIIINKGLEITENNISNVLKNISLAVLTLDDPVTSILIARECLKMKIPLLESWGIPYLWAWWFTPQSIDYEMCYGFNTKKISIEKIRNSKEIITNMKMKIFNKLLQFPEIRERYDREKGTVNSLLSGKIPFVSFAPIVRMTASFLTIEIIFSGIIKAKKMILAPNVLGYDYIKMKPIILKL